MAEIDLNDDPEAARMELRELFAYIWQGRKVVILTTAICLALGFIWFESAPRVYEATATLSAAPGATGSSGGGGGSSLGGAARLFGFGGGSNAVEYTKFQSLLTSSLLSQRLAAKPGFLQQAFPQRWDSDTHSWKSLKAGLFGSATQDQPPTAQDVMGLLSSVLDQSLSLQTQLLTLSARSKNIAFAQSFLTDAHREADNILRDMARMRSRRRIEYLQQTLVHVGAVEQRQALIDLLNQEEQNNMMIESDPNYAADIVDPPHASTIPVSPSFIGMLILCVVGGAVLGLLIYILLRSRGLPGWFPPTLSRLLDLQPRDEAKEPV